jgi:hypothetical protein
MARARERVSLESGLKLDLNRLIRNGTVKPGALVRTSTAWNWVSTGETVARAIITADMRPGNDPSLGIRMFGADEQRIELTAEPRHFGGVQWYFLCPVKRWPCSVLWRPPGARFFASREAFGRQVAYGSQFESARDRALTKAQRIRQRLGGREWLSGSEGFPPKPKGMHWKTYNRLREQCDARQNFALASLLVYVRKLGT